MHVKKKEEEVLRLIASSIQAVRGDDPNQARVAAAASASTVPASCASPRPFLCCRSFLASRPNAPLALEIGPPRARAASSASVAAQPAVFCPAFGTLPLLGTVTTGLGAPLRSMTASVSRRRAESWRIGRKGSGIEGVERVREARVAR